MALSIEYRSVNDLIPYVNNSRTHSDEQVSQVASSIKEFGFTNPILIDEDDSIIAGHGRLMAANKLSLSEVPTITLSGLTEAQKKAYVIADNKLALNSGWNDELLKNEIDNLVELDFDLSLLGFGSVELEKLLQDELDMSLLDEIGDDEVSDFTENVRKAIQIDFDYEHYEEASELVKFWRNEGAYVGGLIMDFLRAEKERL